ncbi:hypothetical protein M758_4G184700 [Ceratodon purpureus]|uniref:Centromere protein O n=1 Tax=Ceratodon purpureus TaxID=3225 RepID=A0A8T0I9V6_CERPU|nr:hypothetical protein KC19_4G182500 [Ceratodon purpureus]KAG0620044.1 hypothetical protein M758_4G184700 [Ceratodon purpureus]
MGEEKEKRKVGERRSAQRIKRVLADTTPKHLEQLTKQARALAGDDGEGEGDGDGEDSSMDAVRRKLGHLHKRHASLREKLTNPSPPQKSLVVRMQEEFEKGIEGRRLEGEEWNDSVIKELQERLYSGDAAVSAQDDREANGEPQIGDRQGGEENMTVLVNRKVIRGAKGGHIVIRFDTAFGAKNFESYYCVLKSNSSMDKLYVVEHSIPFFLPVRELEKQHLSNSPKRFIDHMGDVLQAYVSRREQVIELKKLKGDLIGELYHSLSYTLIEIMLKEPQCQVGLSLAYHNSDSELPTQSTITAWPLSTDLITQTAAKRPGRAILKNSTAFRLPKAEAFLRTMPLPRGFEEFLADLRDTLGLSSPQLVVAAPQVAIEAPHPATEAAKPVMEAPEPATETQPLSNEAQPMEIEAPVEAPHCLIIDKHIP